MDRDADYYGDVTIARYKKENETLRRLLAETNDKLNDTKTKLVRCEKLLLNSMELHTKRKYKK